MRSHKIPFPASHVSLDEKYKYKIVVIMYLSVSTVGGWGLLFKKENV